MTRRRVFHLAFVLPFLAASALRADGPISPSSFWNPDELKIGQKGYGITVLKGAKIERFQAEVLGVLKNGSPGRDLVLCRLAGLDLERTGVIAGMSGSPIYIDNKLVGAIAYAWAHGKDPIAGITPFSQMHSFAESFERRQLADKPKEPIRVGLREPIRADGRAFDAVAVAQDFRSPKDDGDALFMVPLQAPLAVSGMSARSLKLMREQYPEIGIVPMQGGVAGGMTPEEAAAAKIEPGAALTLALITGDFDMSGIGTVTHVEGKRVYGWGHPFMSLGGCELPMMTGWVHTIYPRQTVSFKMGSPLKEVGVINADVSTGIAGWLERKADMLPVSMKVRHEHGGDAHAFNVRIVRHKQMLPSLLFTALTNSIDMEGELPEEMTVAFTCRIDIEGREPLIYQDTFAGSSFSGNKAPSSLFNPVAGLVNQLLNHSFKPVRIVKIECETEIRAGRDAAEIEGVELNAESYAPGDTVRATVYLRPYRGRPIKMPVSVKLPIDLADGSYTLSLLDEVSAARLDLRGRPDLLVPQNEERMIDGLRLLTAAKRTNLVARLPLPAGGVALDGKPLADLPASMVQILGQTRRTEVLPMSAAAVGRAATSWTLYGSQTVNVNVARAKRATLEE